MSNHILLPTFLDLILYDNFRFYCTVDKIWAVSKFVPYCPAIVQCCDVCLFLYMLCIPTFICAEILFECNAHVLGTIIHIFLWISSYVYEPGYDYMWLGILPVWQRMLECCYTGHVRVIIVLSSSWLLQGKWRYLMPIIFM